MILLRFLTSSAGTSYFLTGGLILRKCFGAKMTPNGFFPALRRANPTIYMKPNLPISRKQLYCSQHSGILAHRYSLQRIL